ncbi:hypothetical protein RF11_03764 [Thelohanellus kitauei]|uniref:Uncharacterized protein n=1 Tax=Thelohanellus kitauei TaxID=669202 RepID=A0A0C2N770_THEKT|nr:hypothetical protein RF11_03764 [Thelohanellus kitauei]
MWTTSASCLRCICGLNLLPSLTSGCHRHPVPLCKHIQSRLTLYTSLDAMLSAVFSPSGRYYYEREHRTIQQDSYSLIRDIVEDLNDLTRKWQFCTGASKTVVDMKREDLFFACLSHITMKEMQRLGHDDEKSIVEKIRQLEDLILCCLEQAAPVRPPMETPTTTKQITKSSNKWCSCINPYFTMTQNAAASLRDTNLKI